MVVLNIFHVLIAISMVALVLVQRGAGATAGAAFGSGASGTVFGSRGAGTFLTKSTWVLATLFCGISLTIAVLVSRGGTSAETNLGVVASAAAVVEESEQISTTLDQTGVADAEQGDLPSLQVTEDASDSGALQQEEAADDLPSLDGATVESIERDQDETATGTKSDDS